MFLDRFMINSIEGTCELAQTFLEPSEAESFRLISEYIEASENSIIDLLVVNELIEACVDIEDVSEHCLKFAYNIKTITAINSALKSK
jgi:hypothetical protein